jgi:hypothetical protein
MIPKGNLKNQIPRTKLLMEFCFLEFGSWFLS